MLHVVIDTSIYRADPQRKKAAFRSVIKLASANYLRLYVPYVVEREFSTRQTAELQAEFSKVRSALTGLHRRLRGSTDAVDRMANEIALLESDAVRTSDEEFTEWIRRCKGSVIPVQSNHGANVLKAYFLGAPPFRHLKSRDDIPDAFFMEAVRWALDDLHTVWPKAEIHVVVADEQLLVACRTLASAACYSSLDEFVKCNDFRAHDNEHSLEMKVTLLKAHLKSYEAQLLDHLREMLEADLPYRSFSDRHFRSAPVSVAIETIRAIVETAFLFDRAKLNAVDTLIVPFCCDVTVDAVYSLASDVFRSMTDVEAREVSNILGDSYIGDFLRADAVLTVRVSGSFSLTFGIAMQEAVNPDQDFASDVENAQRSLESIDDISVLERIHPA